MESLKAFIVYWLWPNPAGWYYTDSRVQFILAAGVGLVVLSFVIRFLRRKMKNPVTRTLSASWSPVTFWLGVVALFLTICRVETIQFMSMRLLWALWLLSAVLYVLFQLNQFRRRHYTVIGRATVVDEREKYLPRKK